MALFNIVIKVDSSSATRNTKKVEQDLNRVGAAANKTRDLLAKAFAFGGVGYGIAQLTKLADTYTNIQNRLKTVTSSTAELEVVTDRLFEISTKTRSSYEGTAEVYARIGLAAKDLGRSQNELLGFTESLNKAVILSGASTIEASAGLLQLSQGLASGALRGDELRSVLEQIPVVADVIASGLGVTRGELRQLGTDGKITAEVVLNAFDKASVSLDERFAKSTITSAQGLTILRNTAIKLIGDFDKASGASNALAKLLVFLSDNLETIARVAGAAAIVIGVGFAKEAIGAAINGVRAFGVALLTNPIGVFALALTSVIALLITFGDTMSLSGGSAATVMDFLSEAFRQFSVFAGSALNTVISLISGLGSSLEKISFLDLVTAAAKAFDTLIALFYAGQQVITNNWKELPAGLANVLVRGFNFLLRSTEGFVNKIIEQLNKIPGVTIETLDGVIPQLKEPFADAAENIGLTAGEAFAFGLENGLADKAVKSITAGAEAAAKKRIAAEAEATAAREAAASGLDTRGSNNTPALVEKTKAKKDDKVADRNALLAKALELLDQENELLKVNGIAREVLAAQISLEEQVRQELRETNKTLTEEEISNLARLTDAERDAIAVKVEANEIQKLRNELYDQTAEIQAAVNEQLMETESTDFYIENQTALMERIKELRDQNVIDEQQAAEAIRSFQQKVNEARLKNASAFFGNFEGLAKSGNKRLQQIAKAAAISQAIIDGVLAVQKALSAFPPPFNFIAAAVTGVVAAVNVANIRNQPIGMADGGLVTGQGGPRADKELRALSPGEFVVNAAATRANRADLENINNGGQARRTQGATITQNIYTPDADSFRESDTQTRNRQYAALNRAERRNR